MIGGVTHYMLPHLSGVPHPLPFKQALRYRISILQLYSLAVAGPNGVELYQMKTGDPLSVVCMKYFYFSIVYPFLSFSVA